MDSWFTIHDKDGRTIGWFPYVEDALRASRELPALYVLRQPDQVLIAHRAQRGVRFGDDQPGAPRDLTVPVGVAS